MNTHTDAEATWITLGTSGGPFQDADLFQIANALVAGGGIYLFDIGNGALRQLERCGLEAGRVRAVFLTHHHLDHIADLGLLLVTRWMKRSPEPLQVHGPEGTGDLVAGLLRAYVRTAVAFGDAAGEGLATSAVAIEAPRGQGTLTSVFRDDAIAVESIDVEHFRSPLATERTWAEEHAIGYRITTPGSIVAYTGDTGPCDALIPLAQDADLLVSEVVDVDAMLATMQARFANVPEQERHGVEAVMRSNHLEAREVGAVARTAGVKKVVLTHFVPRLDKAATALLRMTVADAAPGVDVHASADLDRFVLS